MVCMKCGRETASERSFCDECTADMEKYPVNPNIPVIIPKRSSPGVKKAVRKKVTPPEEQIRELKSRIRLLVILLVAVSLLAGVLIYPAVKYMMEDHFLPGQNYTSIVSKSSTDNNSD